MTVDVKKITDKGIVISTTNMEGTLVITENDIFKDLQIVNKKSTDHEIADFYFDSIGELEEIKDILIKASEYIKG